MIINLFSDFYTQHPLLMFQSLCTRCFDQLVQAMTCPTALIPVLYSERLISDTDKTRLTSITHIDNIDKATRLLNAVETTMKAAPRAARVVRELCEAVNDQPALRHVADRITTALGEWWTDWSYCTVLVHPLSDQPAPSTAAPAATPHTPALVQRYIDYLKDRYINKSPILKEKVLWTKSSFTLTWLSGRLVTIIVALGR